MVIFHKIKFIFFIFKVKFLENLILNTKKVNALKISILIFNALNFFFSSIYVAYSLILCPLRDGAKLGLGGNGPTICFFL